MFQSEVDVPLRRHQLQAIADGEFVLHGNGGKGAFTLAGELTHELLTFRNRVTVLVILVVIMRVATQKAFGVTAMRQAFQRFQ
ncbi:Uncharacterised protein [Citrobacter koseri]|nr:Uncharacterised protein [Citrobacter koseri]